MTHFITIIELFVKALSSVWYGNKHADVASQKKKL